MTYVMVYFGAALLAMCLVPVVSQLAKKYRLVDAPGPRKVHRVPVPRVGGIAFVVPTLALVVPMFFLHDRVGLSFQAEQTKFTVLLLAAAFIFGVGFFDDLRSVPGRIKLLCLVVASLAICASGATLSSLSVGKWFEIQTAWAAWPLTVFWIVAITVCMNLIDGLDGLAAGIAAMVCGLIALLAFWTNQPAMAVLMLALLGSVTGFLFFNFHPAKIFMGDGGSMFLGFVIGAGSVVCQTKTPTFVGLAVPFLALGVPVFDTAFAIVRRRLLDRRSVFAPDRSHLHHRLLDLGLHHRTVVITIYAITAINTSLGVFILTSQGKDTAEFLAGGVLLLFVMFACLHSKRPYGILTTLRHNWIITREAKTELRNFETAQVKMREARSFRAWWETLCEMGSQMHFGRIELWSRGHDDYENACTWNAPHAEFATGKTAQFNLPIQRDEETSYEVRAWIWVNGCLELGGRQAMLLARLMDEFPPPAQKEEVEVRADEPQVCVNPQITKTEELHGHGNQTSAARLPVHAHPA
jgi:UDP-GlcNAc:undecaprenyl-phosphate GlcNAc-1-phosphate transferase